MTHQLGSLTAKSNTQPQGLLMRLTKELVRLPGIGQKTAQRLAFHLMKTDTEEALRLAEAIREVKEKNYVLHTMSEHC